MSKYLVVAALVGVVACGSKPQPAPADSGATAATKAAAPAPAASADSTVKVAGDTAKKP